MLTSGFLARTPDLLSATCNAGERKAFSFFTGLRLKFAPCRRGIGSIFLGFTAQICSIRTITGSQAELIGGRILEGVRCGGDPIWDSFRTFHALTSVTGRESAKR
jgi:hypothetical protein